MPTYNENKKIINPMGGEIDEIKIHQEYNENLGVKIQNDLSDPIQVIVRQGDIQSINTKITAPVKVEIQKDRYSYEDSNESKISSKALISLGIIGILYGNNVKISTLFGTNFNDSENIIGGIIFLGLSIELLIFLIIFYRDISNFKTNKRENEIQNDERLKNLKAISKKGTIDKQTLNNIERIQNEKFNKNIFHLGLKTLYPIIIGILGLKYLYINKNYKSINEIFNTSDLFLILICVMAFILFIKWKLKIK